MPHRVLWAARPILDSLGLSSKRKEARTFDDLAADLRSSLQLLEETYDNSVIPSRQAQAARGQDRQDNQQYWSISTTALFILLCRQGSLRQRAARKIEASAVLASMLERLGHGLLQAFQAELGNLPDMVGPYCPVHRPGQCLHVAILQPLSGLLHSKDLGPVLLDLLAQAHVCTKVAWVLKRAVHLDLCLRCRR